MCYEKVMKNIVCAKTDINGHICSQLVILQRIMEIGELQMLVKPWIQIKGFHVGCLTKHVVQSLFKSVESNSS